MTKTVAVLGGGKDSLGILRRIKEMGLRTIVFDGDKEAPARKYLADHFVNISCYDTWHIIHYWHTVSSQCREPGFLPGRALCQ